MAGRARGEDVTADVVEKVTRIGTRAVRSLHAYAASPGTSRDKHPLVVIVPGLGLPYYTLPTVAAVARSGPDAVVLDVPGFASDLPRATRPDINAIGLAAARWIESEAGSRPVVLLGHSTGAQAALTAALALGDRRGLALVLAGPTFAPAQRRVARLLAATPFAYRDDRIEQLHARELWRGRLGIAAMLQSGLRDAPERRVAALAAPFTVTAGRHDAFAPASWLDELAAAAVRSPATRTSLLGGSHNNLWTHPREMAALLLLAAADAVGHDPGRAGSTPR